MSTYFAVYNCESCHHTETIGFVGENRSTVAICSACRDHFSIQAPTGETLYSSAQPRGLFTIGKKQVLATSKKGRVKKNLQVRDWIACGEIPMQEDVVQIGEELVIVYEFDFRSVVCPSCQIQGGLMHYLDYVQYCPQCKTGRMSERSL